MGMALERYYPPTDNLTMLFVCAFFDAPRVNLIGFIDGPHKLWACFLDVFLERKRYLDVATTYNINKRFMMLKLAEMIVGIDEGIELSGTNFNFMLQCYLDFLDDHKLPNNNKK